MTTAERNRKIKSALAAEFGGDKVWVRGSRGTAYGWVSVYIDAPLPEGGADPFDPASHARQEAAAAIKARAWKLIADANVEIGTYGYNDPGSDYGYGSKLSIELRRPYGA